MAPWARLRSLLARIRSGSTSNRVPRRVHVGHAPCGVLKEKLRGSKAGSDVPSYGQAKFAEYSRSSQPPFDVGSLMITWPEPSLSACSTESAMRDLSSDWRDTTRRSTTTAIEC